MTLREKFNDLAFNGLCFTVFCLTAICLPFLYVLFYLFAAPFWCIGLVADKFFD